MDVLITGARAPVALEWARLALAGGHNVWLADSLKWPLGRFVNGIQGYLQLPPPALEMNAFTLQLKQFLHRQNIDLLIPTCEEIFYLAQARAQCGSGAKWLMPEQSLLFQLHHKYQSLSLLDGLASVRTPATRLCESAEQITDEQNTILKPVYSRFGRQFVAQAKPGVLRTDQIHTDYPWVQQERIEGRALCNYALFENGQLMAHQAYQPCYLLNQAASSYFDPISDSRLQAFAQQFGQKTGFHGQAAFDFIDRDGELFCLECNPRATSGLHLLRERLQLNREGHFHVADGNARAFRVGFSLPVMFGLPALRQGHFRQLLHDYRRADDVLKDKQAPLKRRAPWLALLEMVVRMIRWRKPMTDVSTFDIEWNGPQPKGTPLC
ncbi:hypothetical protein BGP77_10160 [Saccharospirillum sp. MSK14-1]|uniref:carbamoyl-phosphate synthase large subunit n=1 Tax=Saccharospirillum sp. MSK14-1 TaxID=1897632 RepID=UPI000D3A928A|nr:carbamoyl-phosphate synthase large subunit [Saccharospirillum sp. MSK14-1]PTY38813.1 hypothetical protein BGP77_10160 [Saccharospirillum sp. MSK14-1]